MRPRWRPLAGLLAVLLLLWAAPAWAGKPERPGREHLVYFAHTPDELGVYRVYGAQDGKTLMIIGGIQGDEPGGFLSADLYADFSLAKGNLIVVPRANFYSIILNHRGPDGDMNRQFGDPVTAQRLEKIVQVLKSLIAESDLLLNLHDGSGFFRPRWEGPLANPMRYGQSLIADADIYKTPDGKEINLMAMAKEVLARVNAKIDTPQYHLLFNNHRTAQDDSIHKEQRLSATYYALTRCHIPAFGVETSKSLPSQSMKIYHHNLVVNSFMDLLDIVPESPGTYMPAPDLKYLVVSVNDQTPMVVAKDGELTVAPDDEVRVLHIEANYERGLNCDLMGLGSVNDLRQPFKIKKSTDIIVRKDSQKIGRVHLRVLEGFRPAVAVRSPLLYFLVEVDGQRRVVKDNESLRVVKGDRLILVDVLSNLPDQSDLQVNFKGFVPEGAGPNQGEDRGFAINTARDLMPRYSHCQGKAVPEVECYRVLAKQGARVVGSMNVEVIPAKLDYLVLRRDKGPQMVYYNGETIQAGPGERMEIMDLKTNVLSGSDLELALVEKNNRVRLQGGLIDTAADPLHTWLKNGKRGVKLLVLRQDQAIGHVSLEIGGR